MVVLVHQYSTRLQIETATDQERKLAMDKVNPKYVLRNYMAQLAIEAAEKEDYSLIEELHLLLKNPTMSKKMHKNGSQKDPTGREKR